MATRFARFVFGSVCSATLTGLVLSVLAADALVPRAAQAQAPSATPAPGAVSPEDEEKARGHFRLGRAYYDNGNFAQAAIEFEEAYRISQRSALLYNIYLAYRDANDTRHAAESLRKYLELQQDVENRGQLEARLAALDRSLADGTAPQPAAQAAAQPAAEAQQQPVAAQAEAAPAAAVQPSKPADEPKSILPWVLMGSGGALAIGGAVFWGMSSSKKSELSSKCPNMTCDPSKVTVKQVSDLKSSGSTLAAVGDALFFGGLAVAGTGVVLFILDAASGGNESAPAASAPTASLVCLPGSCAGAVAMKF